MDIKLNIEFVALLITIITMGVGCFFSIKSALKEWRREHREDLDKMDAKIDKMDEKFDANFKFMEQRWERLFSLFVAQIQKDK